MAGNNFNSSSVQPQWELGQTTFQTTRQLRDLITIASQPNVQPQAVLAAEQLGFGLLASPERIDEAIVALDGNESTRVGNLRAFVGFASDDLQRLMRQSTGLLQFFLATTACKPCYEDTELGDLAFEMMVHASILKRYPVASSQLAQLVRTFSSQAESIAPVTVMQEIAVAVAEHNPGPDLYSRIETKALAEILVRTFEILRDTEAQEVVLTGHNHGVWLATLFSWLIPDKVQVTVDKEIIRGSQGAKLTIEIDAEGDSPWQMEVWRNGGDVASHVFEYDKDDLEQLHRLPIVLAQPYFDQYYCSAFEDNATRRKAIEAMGDFAGALIRFLTEKGKLNLPRGCCPPSARKCSMAVIKDVIGQDAILQYSRAVTKYGWAGSDTAQMEAYRLLEENIATSIPSPKSVMEKVQTACSLFIKNAVGDVTETNYIIEPACYIAVDAVTTSTASLVSGCRYFSPLTAEDFREGDDAIGALLSNDGLDIKEFRHLAFQQLLPGLGEFNDRDLVVSNNGHVAGMAVLWKCSTIQQDVLGIRYIKGGIQRDGISYDRIREADFSSFSLSSRDQEPITLCKRGQYLGIPLKTEHFSFETRTSIQGSHLVVKHYIQRPTASTFTINDIVVHKKPDQATEKRKASWISSIYVLATGVHVGRGYELTLFQEAELAKRLHDANHAMRWASSFGLPEVEDSTRLILRTSGTESVRFFAAGLCYDKQWPRERCFSFVIRHNAPLLSCVHVAEQTQKPWLIAC
jgi:hypothetical protein